MAQPPKGDGAAPPSLPPPASFLSTALRACILCSRTAPWRSVVASKRPSPLGEAGFISRLWFQWASGLVAVGYERPLQMTDLWQLRPFESADDAHVELAAAWDAELRAKGPAGASFARVAWRFVRYDLFLVFCLKMGWLLFAVVGNAWLLRELITFFADGATRPLWHGLLLALGFVVSESARSLCVNHHWLVAVLIGVRLRAGVRALLYRKTLTARPTHLNSGQAVTLLTNDASRLLEACNYAEFCVSAPLTVIVAMGVMLWVIGPAALAGFAVLLIFSPLQARIGGRLAVLRRATAKITDERVRVMAELLTGVRLLKLYGYEAAFAEKVAGIRAKEVGVLRRAAVIRVVNSVAAFSLPVLVTLATFATNALMGNPLRPAAAFVVLALFNVARFPLSVLPQATRCVSEASVACKRIQAFLALPEVVAADKPVQLPTATAGDAGGDGADAEAEAFAGARERAAVLLGLAPSAVVLPQADIAIESRGASFLWEVPPPSAPSAAAAGGGKKGAAAPLSSSAPTPAPAAQPTTPSPPPLTLHDISMTVRRGQLVGVVGAVGAGKSSLLAAVLGHMTRIHGAVFLQGTVAYAAQVPWIFSGTLRDNILFGRPYEEQAFRRAVHACALDADLASFPAGDKTEIGERGINLSGGQKARVAFARAVYADADIYLLDDPLSAVDAHVGRHLWRHAIERALKQRGKTVVIVTHQLQYLPRCDAVAVVSAGRIDAFGPSGELAARGVDMRGAAGSGAGGIMSSGAAADSWLDGEDEYEHHQGGGDKGKDTEKDETAVGTAGITIVVAPSTPPAAAAAAAAATTASAVAAGGKLVATEDRAIGAVGNATFASYFRAAGGLHTAVSIVLVLLIGKGSRQVSDWFLSYWTQGGRMAGIRAEPLFGGNGGDVLSKENQLDYAGVYAASVLVVMLANLIQGLIFAVVSLVAARAIHDRVFASVMRATLGWHDSQPTGRTLSRFTGDVDVVDNALPPTLETCLDFMAQCALSVVLIIAIFPYFIVAAVPLLAIFVYVTRMFRRVARELKRLDNISRGPLVSHITASAQGVATIHSYGQGPRFVAENDRHVDLSTRSYWALYALNRWVAIRVDVVTTLTAGVTALLCVMSREWLPPALAGLSVSYALSLAGVLQYTMRLTTETEANFTSVERLTHYADHIPHEVDAVGGEITDEEAKEAVAKTLAAYPAATSAATAAAAEEEERENNKTVSHMVAGAYPGWYPSSWSRPLRAAKWPMRGSLAFEGVSLRYREGLPLVLSEVTFRVAPGHTVGIVGRTGSGKTTLSLSLFRVLELAAGRIMLDGVDISKVSVHQLRRGLAVIPQDPTLFRGTLRSNLDLFSEHEDSALWRVLGEAGIDEWVRGLPGAPGLEAPVQEGGSNLSVGQRQLLCLARALLRGSRVIVMDEATASLDAASDALIQRALRTSLRARGCTLLVIAHRLHTVMDCDRILSLKDGRVAEYDDPAALLGLVPQVEGGGGGGGGRGGMAPSGILASLVEETGPDTAAELRRLAREGHDGRRKA
jgi:ABC-type multidrug transport system fused ATPase/permease subunit